MQWGKINKKIEETEGARKKDRVTHLEILYPKL
jgi:hypothetical protein